tara:strand:- start:1451 stop:1642 length:192 start_codon:yes stop_codon:yes gene_type:complete
LFEEISNEMTFETSDQRHSAEKVDNGIHATRIETNGAVIDEVTGEEVEPVVTFKTWIVVLASV